MSHELGSLTPPAITMRGDETMSRSIVPRSGWERGQGSVRRKCRSRKARRQAQRGSSPRWGFATSGKLSHCPDKNMWRCVSVQERVCVCMRSGARAPNTPKASRKSLIGEDCLLNSVRKHPQVLAQSQHQKHPAQKILLATAWRCGFLTMISIFHGERAGKRDLEASNRRQPGNLLGLIFGCAERLIFGCA
jgi:hypothetical protein